MPRKEVKVKVVSESDLSGVEPLENKVKQLRNTQLHLQIDADKAQLEEVDSRIESIKEELSSLKGQATVDDSKVKELESELASLEQESVNLQVKVATNELKAAKELEESLNDTATLQLKVEGMESIKEGLSGAKEGVSGLIDGIGEVQKAGMQSQQNKAFLGLNEDKLGGKSAVKVYQDISDIVKDMPGDDNTMRSVLSTAQALGNNLNPTEMRDAAGTMADYMAGSATMGKQALESQQDIMKYLLDGNTAELERGSIVSSQVDKLKEATTFQERQAAMQEVLNELGYGGIANAETLLNKQQEWEGMMYNAQDILSSMWIPAEQAAMDYFINIDNQMGHIPSMGLAIAQVAAGPIVDLLGGIGQIGMGISAIKDLGFIQWLKDLELVTYAQAAASKIAAAADWLLAGAQAVLNFVMSMNPIVLVVIALIALAAALVWAYYNVDWFREMVDNAWASIVQFAMGLWNTLTGAIQWIANLFQNFTNQLGLNTNDWIQAVLGFILFLPTLPLQIGIALTNAIARALGFKGNFVQTLWQTAMDGVQQFANAINGIPQALQNCLNWAYNIVMSNPLVQALKWLGEQAVYAFSVLGLNQGSPGDIFKAMKNELSWTEDEINNSNLDDVTASLGSRVSESFNPNLKTLNRDSTLLTSGGNGDTIINVYGDVDSDRRVKQIVDAVRRELSWDNSKAGRGV